jgi:hypothetical protein
VDSLDPDCGRAQATSGTYGDLNMRIEKYFYYVVLPFLFLTLGHADKYKLPPPQLQTILDSTATYIAYTMH